MCWGPVPGLGSGVAAIAAGYYHTCALTSAGGVECWGWNDHGQLGDGRQRCGDVHCSSLNPVAVAGLASGVAAIAAGGYHTCALMSGGGVKCWGDNESGQLGDGTTIDRHTPVDVSGLASGVAAISAGGAHSCALSSGGVLCWGYNTYGQLGDGTTDMRHTPVAVSGLASGVTAISAGGGHTCALTSASAAVCWGYNGSGQLGDGTTTDRHAPVAVSGLASGVAAIAPGGAHTCALTTAGGVRCWGWNRRGQLGDGTTTGRRTPVAVSGLASGVKAIAAGNEHTCALTSPGGVDCWGWNGEGELGDWTTVTSLEPVGVIGFGGSIKCAVPYARGLLLPAARSIVAHAHCRVGTVKRVASRKRKNTVVGQSPRPYRRLNTGARVNLKISRGL